MSDQALANRQALEPTDVAEWLRIRGWNRVRALGDIAQLWRHDDDVVLVPLLTSAPDFTLRWNEMLSVLANSLDTDTAGVLLAVAKAGSDIAEFRATGQIDDSLPLGDASIFLESVRRSIQATANSALQPRSCFGRSLPEAAREHARNVRMGQTRRGSYIIPVISRLPVLRPENAEDAVLFDDSVVHPFARTAMLRLAQGIAALRELTHGPSQPSRSRITETVGFGVSSELCDAVASTLDTESITTLDVNFTWAERLQAESAPESVNLESDALGMIRHVGRVLRGEPVVGKQTFVGYVKRLDRGEEDDIGRITLRVLDNDKARNITMELNDSFYHVAGKANTDRLMVSVTGELHREPGRALRFIEVTDFRLLENLPLFTAGEMPHYQQ